MAQWIIDNIWLVGAVSLGAVVGLKWLVWRWFARLTAAPSEPGRKDPGKR